MSVNPGFTWDDIVTGLNSFLAIGAVSAILVAVIVLGVVPMIAAALRGLLHGGR